MQVKGRLGLLASTAAIAFGGAAGAAAAPAQAAGTPVNAGAGHTPAQTDSVAPKQLDAALGLPNMADLRALQFTTGGTPALAAAWDPATRTFHTVSAHKTKKAKKAEPYAKVGGPKVEAMIRKADSLLGKPYVVGGGHGGWEPSVGYDCSGFVSAVLHAGGFLSEPQTTVTLPDQPGIERGAGQHVTVYDRPLAGEEGHTIIDINGQFYESGGSAGYWGGGGGVEKIGRPAQWYLDTFSDVLHPKGL